MKYISIWHRWKFKSFKFEYMGLKIIKDKQFNIATIYFSLSYILFLYLFLDNISKTNNNVQENIKKIFKSAFERPSHCRQSPQNMATRPHRIYVTGIITKYSKEYKYKYK